MDDGARAFMSDYLGHEVRDPVWDADEDRHALSGAHVYHAAARRLALGSDARMNTPGQPAGNWTWRFTGPLLDRRANPALAHLTWLYQRRADQQEKEYGDAAL